MFPPGLEPGTFRVLGERDNHYTTETTECCIAPISSDDQTRILIQTDMAEQQTGQQVSIRGLVAKEMNNVGCSRRINTRRRRRQDGAPECHLTSVHLLCAASPRSGESFTFGIPKFGIATPSAEGVPGVVTTVSSSEEKENKPLFSFQAHKLESQWRDVEWTEEKKTSLMKTITSYRPRCEEVSQARVLLLGPVSSGKSSFISSVHSVFNGRVTNRAMVGSSSTSFTKKSFNIHCQKGDSPNGLVLCDIMGLGDGEMSGLSLHDILSVIKGHAPEGHKFSLDQPVRSETVGYVKRPSLKDKIHCVVFVVNASKMLTYPKGLSTTFQQLREHISDLGVHQVALLTHIDQICPETNKDVTHVYKSRSIQDMMGKAGALLGMSTSYIVPVKNYSSELDLDVNTDVLLLSAVDHILQYADLYFQDHAPQYTKIEHAFTFS
ncbi:interferon-induced protein 44 isoform X2 [Larimichthys crocea]|uniref:interferon-induced protein 44 isoform X2 n=1 Tax=Larimichthys crocea TaxID=215358 RepID=UPI000F5E3B57|nr:interferon-induced protein 44 isoform X2 [Larimichthys crocea]